MKSENFVKSLLEEWEFNVHKIDETDDKTPDFYVTMGTENYLIEVKEKEDSNGDKNILDNLEEGKIQNFTIKLIESGSISRILKKGQKQIDTFAEGKDTFRIIWFVCTGVHLSSQVEVIKQSLYDTLPLWDLDDKLFKETVPLCYFFGNNSKFFKYKNELDAVVVGTYEKGELCLNPFSPRYKELKSSTLLKKFGEGFIDPENEEKLKRGIIADGTIDRSNQGLVLKYLEEKYGTKFKPFPHLDYHSVVLKTPI